MHIVILYMTPVGWFAWVACFDECMSLANKLFLWTEWFYSIAHCLQEKPYQSYGAASEIWGFNPGYNRGRTGFLSFQWHLAISCFPLSCLCVSSRIDFSLSPLSFLSNICWLVTVDAPLVLCRGVKCLLVCFTVWSHSNTCGCFHGPLEHSPPSAAEWSLSRCH